jgi:hypothetical protein
VFTARYALSPYIKQIRFVFKGLNLTKNWILFKHTMKIINEMLMETDLRLALVGHSSSTPIDRLQSLRRIRSYVYFTMYPLNRFTYVIVLISRHLYVVEMWTSRHIYTIWHLAVTPDHFATSIKTKCNGCDAIKPNRTLQYYESKRRWNKVTLISKEGSE